MQFELLNEKAVMSGATSKNQTERARVQTKINTLTNLSTKRSSFLENIMPVRQSRQQPYGELPKKSRKSKRAGNTSRAMDRSFIESDEQVFSKQPSHR